MVISVEYRACYESLKDLCLKLMKEHPQDSVKDLLQEEKIWALAGKIDRETFLPIFRLVKTELERESHHRATARPPGTHPDIQHHFSVVLQMMRGEFEDVIKNLREELLQRDHEMLDLLKRIDRLHAVQRDSDQEIRFLKEEMSLQRSQIDMQKEEILRKEKDLQKQREQILLLEGQQQIKEHGLHRLDGELKKINEELLHKEKELLEKQKLFLDFQSEKKGLESKVGHLDGMVQVKDVSIAEINKSYMMEQEETRKVKKELSKKNEEVYALVRELENTRNHLKMAKEDYINLKTKSEYTYS